MGWNHAWTRSGIYVHDHFLLFLQLMLLEIASFVDTIPLKLQLALSSWNSLRMCLDRSIYPKIAYICMHRRDCRNK